MSNGYRKVFGFLFLIFSVGSAVIAPLSRLF
jgi:hypothetical protein